MNVCGQNVASIIMQYFDILHTSEESFSQNLYSLNTHILQHCKSFSKVISKTRTRTWKDISHFRILSSEHLLITP
jgi:hypothetical protein